MDYQGAIDYLYGLQRFGIKLGLSNITRLLEKLGNPQKDFKSVHIAGSNGKGSVASFLTTILSKQGYKVGLFTSPHLIDFTERIRINNEFITKREVAGFVEYLKGICKEISLEYITFFEFVTAMAFLYFKQKKVDLAVVEVGMGGRYDATNVIKPLVSIITNISLEHKQYLGDTLLKIANEKAGIIKPNTSLVTGVTRKKIIEFYERKCEQLKSNLYLLGRDFRIKNRIDGTFDYIGIKDSFKNLYIGLKGDHQISNSALCLATIEVLKGKGFSISERSIREGLRENNWQGRLELIKSQPQVLLDGAHNPDAWRTLRKALKKYFTYRRLFLVVGMMEDKDISKMVKILFPLSYKVFFTHAKINRAATYEKISPYICSLKEKVLWYEDLKDALDRAFLESSRQDLICITGSLFIVGEAREYLLGVSQYSSGRIAM